MRVAIAGTVETRGGRPSFAALADGTEGLIELDNSAAAKLAGRAVGDARIGAINGARAMIEDAATRLHQTGCATQAADGRWLLLLSALDLD